MAATGQLWYGRNAFGVSGQLLGDALGKGKIEFVRQKHTRRQGATCPEASNATCRNLNGRPASGSVVSALGSGNAAQRRPALGLTPLLVTDEPECRAGCNGGDESRRLRENERMGDLGWAFYGVSRTTWSRLSLAAKGSNLGGREWWEMAGGAVLQGSCLTKRQAIQRVPATSNQYTLTYRARRATQKASSKRGGACKF